MKTHPAPWTPALAGRHAAALLGAGLLTVGLLGVPAARGGPPEAAPDAALDAPSPLLACAAAADPRVRLPSGLHLAAMPREPRPARGEVTIDRVHGSCLVRLTDRAGEAAPGPVAAPATARAAAPRRQAFNADESRLLLAGRDGRWQLHDARTLRHRGALPPVIDPGSEPQWHPSEPERLYHLSRDGTALQLLEFDLRTGRTRVAADFAMRLRQLWPEAHAVRSGGASPSADGRTWAFLVDDARGRALGLFTWDLQEHRLLASLDLAAQGRARPEQLAMSPSGAHLVVAGPEGTVAYTRELTQPRRLQARGEPFDLALAADGEDAYVSVDAQAPGAPLFLVRLRSGKRTELFPTAAPPGRSTALRVSGLAHRRPGWVLVSTHGDQGKGARQWLHRRLMAVELRAEPRIVHLAFHRNPASQPGAEPRASVNRDFTRVLFDSSWSEAGGTGSPADTYLVLLGRDALPR